MSSTFQLSQPATQRRFKLSADKPVASLSERYRPATLAMMVGQGPTVFRLESFLETPYSAAFLFEGPTGVGKTTAALAVAAELGAVEFGGLEIVKSGTQDAETVERVIDGFRFAPMLGSGWKVAIVDEADYMSVKAAQIWLSALEDLPSKTLVIFTTNDASKFKDRFLDRCERFAFDAEATVHTQDAQALADDVWTKETGGTDSPKVATMPGVVNASGQISYRRVIRALEPLIAAHKSRPVTTPKTQGLHPCPWSPTGPIMKTMRFGLRSRRFGSTHSPPLLARKTSRGSFR